MVPYRPHSLSPPPTTAALISNSTVSFRILSFSSITYPLSRKSSRGQRIRRCSSATPIPHWSNGGHRHRQAERHTSMTSTYINKISGSSSLESDIILRGYFSSNPHKSFVLHPMRPWASASTVRALLLKATKSSTKPMRFTTAGGQYKTYLQLVLPSYTRFGPPYLCRGNYLPPSYRGPLGRA